VVLDRPPAAVPELVRQHRLLERVREHAALVVGSPRSWHLELVEEVEDHARLPATPADCSANGTATGTVTAKRTAVDALTAPPPG
jgi:hypothetical protein